VGVGAAIAEAFAGNNSVEPEVVAIANIVTNNSLTILEMAFFRVSFISLILCRSNNTDSRKYCCHTDEVNSKVEAKNEFLALAII
jgi:hypothetical protein